MPLFNLEILSKLFVKYDNLNTIKDINMKLWILACHDMCSCKTTDIILKAIFFGVMSLYNLGFLSKLLIMFVDLKTIKDINMKLWILVIITRCSCKAKGITLKAVLLSYANKHFK